MYVWVRRPKISPLLPQSPSWLMDEGEEPFMYYYCREPGPWRGRDGGRERGNSLVCEYVLCTLPFKYIWRAGSERIQSRRGSCYLFNICLASTQLCSNLTAVSPSWGNVKLWKMWKWENAAAGVQNVVSVLGKSLHCWVLEKQFISIDLSFCFSTISI